MKTSSAKAKGRRLQQLVRDDLRAIAPQLDPTDVESTPMGCNGVDVILTKAARAVFGELAIECKNVERLNAIGVFQGHLDKYRPKGKIALLVHSRNHAEPRVTLLWADFVRLYLRPAIGNSLRETPTHALPLRDPRNPNADRVSRKSTFFAVDEGLACPVCSHDNRAEEHCGGKWHQAQADAEEIRY